MARTRKSDKAKNAAQAPEATEPTKEAAQGPETAEPTKEAEQGPKTVELETEEPTKEAAQGPETVELETKKQNAKTSPEDAAAIETSAAETKMEISETGEITITEPDAFARLPNPCVYCGPSIKGVARQYTTYQGGIPDALREFIKAHPHALGLIVSTGNFPSMRKRMETRGTLEAELYKAVKAEI